MAAGPEHDPPRRAALLVIHGIGQQAPLSNLDRVIRGLRIVLAERVDRMSHTTSLSEGRVTSGVRIELNTPLPRSGAAQLDVYEGYWAPKARGLIGVRGVLGWFALSLLIPFRRWSRTRLEHVSLGRRIELVTLELLAAFSFAAMLGAEAAIVVWYLRHASPNPLSGYDLDLLVVVEATAAIAATAFLVLGFRAAVMPMLGEARRSVHRWYVSRVLQEAVTFEDEGIGDRQAGHESRRIWSGAAWVGFVATAAIVAAIEWRADGPPGPASPVGDLRIERVSDFGRNLWLGIALFVFASVIGRFLASVAGDVALYTAEDADTSAGQFRTHLLDSVQAQLRGLLDDPRYETVHLLGHSLGTVIGYDALNRFRLEVEHALTTTEPDPALLSRAAYDRLATFVTVACPLDHTSYLFGATAGHTRPIQHQLIERQRGLRTLRSLDDPGRFGLDTDFATGVRCGYYPLEPATFAWLNIKACPDPIGTRLLGFQPDECAQLRYFPLSLSAHIRVMDDRRTYELMLPYL